MQELQKASRMEVVFIYDYVHRDQTRQGMLPENDHRDLLTPPDSLLVSIEMKMLLYVPRKTKISFQICPSKLTIPTLQIHRIYRKRFTYLELKEHSLITIMAMLNALQQIESTNLFLECPTVSQVISSI